MKLKTILLVIGLFLIILALLAIATISQLTQWVSSFAEQYASADQTLTATAKTRISISLLSASLMGLISGVMFLAARQESFRSSILRALQDNPFQAIETTRLKPYRILVYSTILTLAFIALYIWRIIDPRLDAIYDEGGLVESLTAIAFGISAGLIFLAIRARLQKGKMLESSSKLWLIPYISIMLGFFVLAMEEINWGQPFLGWKTPDTLANFNRQGETNLHNIIEAFELLYYPLALLFPLELLSGWLRTRIAINSVVLRILPRPNTIILAAVISTLAFIAVGINEFVEQLFAFFALLYSYQVLSAEKLGQMTPSDIKLLP